jgi:hypothetical protein
MVDRQHDDRQGEIEKFNNDDNVQTFFISLKAGGTGLNLTAADYVFILDPWWTRRRDAGREPCPPHRSGSESDAISLYHEKYGRRKNPAVTTL